MEKTMEEILVIVGFDGLDYTIGIEETLNGWEITCSDLEEQDVLRDTSPIFESRQEAIDYIVASWPDGAVLI